MRELSDRVMMVASTVAVGRRVLMMCSWVHCLVSGTKQYTLYTQVRFVTRNKCVSSILFGMVAMHASVMRHIWRPTGHRAFDEDTRFQGLLVASFAPDYTSRRSGSRSSVGFRVHNFPAGLL